MYRIYVVYVKSFTERDIFLMPKIFFKLRRLPSCCSFQHQKNNNILFDYADNWRAKKALLREAWRDTFEKKAWQFCVNVGYVDALYIKISVSVITHIINMECYNKLYRGVLWPFGIDRLLHQVNVITHTIYTYIYIYIYI